MSYCLLKLRQICLIYCLQYYLCGAEIYLIKLFKILFLEVLIVKNQLMNEQILKAQLKLVQLNELLMMLKEEEHTYLTGDIEKVNYDLQVILERMSP